MIESWLSRKENGLSPKESLVFEEIGALESLKMEQVNATIVFSHGDNPASIDILQFEVGTVLLVSLLHCPLS